MMAQAPSQQLPEVEPQPAPSMPAPAPAPAPVTYDRAAPVPPAPATSFPPYAPPVGYGMPAPGSWQPNYLPRSESAASSGQRLSLAIASLALMIPLIAIVVNFPVSLGTMISAGLAISTGLIGVALIALAVVGVNIAFNFDLLRRRR